MQLGRFSVDNAAPLVSIGRRPKFLIEVPEQGLCHGCGGCSGACPTDAITMRPTPQGTLAPEITLDLCTNCGLCFSVCPGHSFDMPYFHGKLYGAPPPHPEVGHYREIYAGYAADPAIQWAGQSGGVISALLIDLLERGEIQGAVVTRAHPSDPTKAETFIARNRADILSCVGSKYGPVSAAEGIGLIRKEKGRFVFVGVSCQIHAFRKASEFSKTLAPKIYAYFGLHCKGIYSTHFFDFLLARYGLKPSDVKSFNLRSKEWRGWPADLRIETHAGKTIDLSGGLSRTGPRDYFAQMRCLTCTDKLNEFSDISFGDCRVPWVYDKKTLHEAEGGGNPGQSDIVVRSEAGSRIMASAIERGILVTKAMDWRDIVVSTKPSEKKLAINNLRLLSRPLNFSIPDYGVVYAPKTPREKKLFRLLQLPTLVSSATFVLFWKYAHRSWVRRLYRLLPLRYIHLAGGVRRRLTNYRQANLAELEASYRAAGEMKVLPGTCHPLAGKKKKRSAGSTEGSACAATLNE
jgi:coenzyme F420 hydrogenase subunit beta